MVHLFHQRCGRMSAPQFWPASDRATPRLAHFRIVVLCRLIPPAVAVVGILIAAAGKALAHPKAPVPDAQAQEYRDALAVLEKNPTHTAANLAAGRYLCFVKGDWGRGLPMLALGSDAELKAVSTLELQGTDSVIEQLTVADAWWALAKTKEGSERNALRIRAGLLVSSGRGEAARRTCPSKDRKAAGRAGGTRR